MPFLAPFIGLPVGAYVDPFYGLPWPFVTSFVEPFVCFFVGISFPPSLASAAFLALPASLIELASSMFFALYSANFFASASASSCSDFCSISKAFNPWVGVSFSPSLAAAAFVASPASLIELASSIILALYSANFLASASTCSCSDFYSISETFYPSVLSLSIALCSASSTRRSSRDLGSLLGTAHVLVSASRAWMLPIDKVMAKILLNIFINDNIARA